MSRQDRSDIPSFPLILVIPGKDAESPLIKILNRGDSRAPEEIFKNGFKACGNSKNPVAHMLTPTTGQKKASGFVATSTSKDVAKGFAFTRSYDGYIYEINPQKHGIDMKPVIQSLEKKGLFSPEKLQKYYKELEVAVPDKIKPQDILRAWKVKAEGFDVTNGTYELVVSTDPEPIVNTKAKPNRTAKVVTQVAQSAKPASRVLTAVAVVSDGVRLHDASVRSQEEDDIDIFFREAASVVGGWVGAYVGGHVGAMAAGGICSLVSPGVGTIVCSIAGGVVGSAYGYSYGSELGKLIYDNRASLSKALAEGIAPIACAAPPLDSFLDDTQETPIPASSLFSSPTMDHFLQSLPDQLSMAPLAKRSTADDMKYFFTNYFWKEFGEEPGDGDPYQLLVEKLQGRRPEGKTGLWINFGLLAAEKLPNLMKHEVTSRNIRFLQQEFSGEEISDSEFMQAQLAEKISSRLSSGVRQVSSDRLSLEEGQQALDNTFADIEGMLEGHEPLTQFTDDMALQESETMKKMSGINDAVATMLKFHAAEEIDASAYMHVEAVQEAHTALEEAKSENASPEVIHTHQLSLKRALSQAAVDQKQFQQNLSDVGQCASGMAVMLSVFGQAEAAHQVTTVVSAGTAVAACVDRLQSGATTALGMGASVMGMLGAVSSIYGLFIRQKSQDMSQVILQAIQDISRQVETLRDEMHRRFDDFESLLEKRHRALLDNFCHLHQATAINHAYIRQLYVQVNELFYDQTQRMKPMDTMLRRLEDTLTHRQLEASRDELNKLMHLIMAHPVKPFDRYDEVANQMKAIALSDSVTHQPHDPMTLHTLERHPDNYLHFVTHYYGLLSLSLGFDEQSKLPDMSIMLPALLFNLVMDIKQFPNPEQAEAHLKPSRGVANRYEDYLAALNQYASHIVNARRDTVVVDLIEKYERAATQFGRTLESQLSHIEKNQTGLIRAETASKLGPLRESHTTGLVNTTIEPGSYGWFEGKVYRGYRSWAGKAGYPNASTYTGATHVDQFAKRAYLETLTAQIRAHKQHASVSAQESRHEAESALLSLYENSRIGLHHGAGVLVPYDAALPYLPLPDPLFDEAHEPDFLKIARQAQAAGVGNIEFMYSLHDDNKKLLISVFIRTSSQQILMGGIGFKLDTRYFNLPEGVWHDWMGGKIAPDKDGTRHHVCVSGRFIPKWQSWANTRTSAQVVSLVANDVMVCKTGVGHKAGCYDFSLALYHNPKPLEEIKGKSELLKTHAVDGFVISPIQAGIDSVLDLIKASKQTFKEKCLEALRDSLDAQRDTALGNACHELESTFRDLYGMCSFAFHDTMADPESPLAQWFSQYALDLEAVKAHYRSVDKSVSPRQLVENMTGKLPELTRIIKQTRAALIDRQHGLVDPDFGMMAEVTQQMHAVLAFYEPHLTEFEDMVDVAGGLQVAMDAITGLVANLCQANLPADVVNTILARTLEDTLGKLETENPATKSYWVSLLKQRMTDKKLPIAWQGNKMLLYKPGQAADDVGKAAAIRQSANA